MIAVDQAARDQALDISQSICVTAPAGSGKTELLTQRLLKLLAVVENPEQVLAITFTRKAAAEMRERVIEALQLGLQTEQPAEQHKILTWQLAQQALANSQQKQWEILQNPMRIRVQTIDSLCQSITREQPIVSQFGSSPQAVDNAAHLYDQAIDNLLANLESQAELSDDIAAALLHVDNNMERLKVLLVSLLAKRDQWLHHTFTFSDDAQAKQQLEQDLQRWIEEQLLLAAEVLLPVESDLCQLVDYAAANLALEPKTKTSALAQLAGIAGLPEPDISELKQWQAIASLLLTASGSYRKKVDARNGFPAPTSTKDKEQKALYKQRKDQFAELIGHLQQLEGAEQALTILSQLPTSAYGAEQWSVLGPLTRILNNSVGYLKLVFGQTGQCDHLEITHAALRSLGDELAPTASRLRWDHTLRHILVDEFQDTAYMQFGLIKQLTSTWPEENEVDPDNPRTLFVVGDGMQSIYGFRAAKVGLFLQAKEQGIGDLPLLDVQLEQNFRSAPAVVEWNNAVFSDAFPNYTDIARGAVPFYSAIPAQADTDYSAVSVTVCANQTSRQREADIVAEKIQQTWQQNPNHSVAVLVRARTALTDIIPALKAADIPWQATDLDPLAKTEVISDALALTKALLNPADKLAWLSVLRSPLAGLPLTDLQRLTDFAGYNFASSLLQLSAEQITELQLSKAGTQILQRVITVIQTTWQLRGRKALRQWVESTWHDLGGLAVIANSEQYDHVQQYFDLLEALDSDGEGFSLTRLQTRLQSLYAQSSQTAANPVQIMTIHKSKGLEFDTVILPALDRLSASDDKKLLYWHEPLYEDGAVGLVLCPLDTAGDESELYQFLAAEQKRILSLEATRLLYVAATRAKQQLHFVANAQVNDDGVIKQPASNSLLAKIWPSVSEQVVIDSQDANTDTAVADNPTVITTLKRLPPSFTLTMHEGGVTSASSEEDSIDIQTSEEGEDSPLARIIGIVVHEILQSIVETGLLQWDETKVNQLQPAWRLRLLHAGIAQQELDAALHTVTTAVNNTLTDEQGRWLLDKQLEQSVCEWPLTYKTNNVLFHYVIDRSFVVNGERWIIDYKTAQPKTGQELAEFLTEQSNNYAEQLTNYATACQAFDGLPVRTALYFPSIAQLHEIRTT